MNPPNAQYTVRDYFVFLGDIEIHLSSQSRCYVCMTGQNLNVSWCPTYSSFLCCVLAVAAGSACIPGGPRSAGCGSAMCSNHRHRAGVRPGLQGAALRHVLHGAVFCSAAGLQVVNGCSDNPSLTAQSIEPVLHSNDLPSFTFWCRV